MASINSITSINPKTLATEICQALKPRIDTITQILGCPPGLTVILVGHRKDSEIYVRHKKKKAQELGINSQCLQFETTVTTEEILSEIDQLNQDPKVHAILVQLPLPEHLDTDRILSQVNPFKDVDGFHPTNVGRLALNSETLNYLVPCTPLGVMTLLDYLKLDLMGQKVVIIGASRVVGLPLFHLLLHRQATVTLCHDKTKELRTISQTADILIVACGQPKMVTAEWIKPNAVVIDVGINYISSSSSSSSPSSSGLGTRLVGDVDYLSVLPKAKYISPVPGGIGPLTVATLMANTVKACEFQINKTN